MIPSPQVLDKFARNGAKYEFVSMMLVIIDITMKSETGPVSGIMLYSEAVTCEGTFGTMHDLLCSNIVLIVKDPGGRTTTSDVAEAARDIMTNANDAAAA